MEQREQGAEYDINIPSRGPPCVPQCCILKKAIRVVCSAMADACGSLLPWDLLSIWHSFRACLVIDEHRWGIILGLQAQPRPMPQKARLSNSCWVMSAMQTSRSFPSHAVWTGGQLREHKRTQHQQQAISRRQQTLIKGRRHPQQRKSLL